MTIVDGAGTANEVRKQETHHPMQTRQLPPTRPASYFRWKIFFDRGVAALLLLPGLPIMAVMIMVIRFTSRGPAIFRQQRVGKDGKVFTMFKLRTMRIDAEDSHGAVWAQDDDPRATPVGKFLRRYHMDEIPQLFNILAGEMSLIGPRPERPEFVTALAVALPGYEDRLLVHPGITGLAQINLEPDTDLTSVAKKLALDLEYVETGSLWLDIRVLLCTLVRMVKVGSDIWPGLLGITRHVKGHPKYITPVKSDVRPKNGALTANELVNEFANKIGSTINSEAVQTIEARVNDGTLSPHRGNGDRDGGSGNGKHQSGVSIHPGSVFHPKRPR